MQRPVSGQCRRPTTGQPDDRGPCCWRLAWSGGRAQAAPGSGGEQVDVGVRQHPVIAKRAAEQVGGHDRHALHVQAAAVDMGAVHAHHRGSAGAEQPADDPCLPADRLQDAIQRVVVVPGQPVGALADAAGSLLGVDHEHP